jgi:hypothetical protein
VPFQSLPARASRRRGRAPPRWSHPSPPRTFSIRLRRPPSSTACGTTSMRAFFPPASDSARSMIASPVPPPPTTTRCTFRRLGGGARDLRGENGAQKHQENEAESCLHDDQAHRARDAGQLPG